MSAQEGLRVSTTDVVDAPLGIVLISFAVNVVIQCAYHLHATQHNLLAMVARSIGHLDQCAVGCVSKHIVLLHFLFVTRIVNGMGSRR